MYFSFLPFTILVLGFSIGLNALNPTTTTTTTKASITTCKKHSQCPSTHFCNSKQQLCLLKRSVNGVCADSAECLSNKCHEKICRQSCKIDTDCSLTKEYCSSKNFCSAKHCSFCTRNAQCANKDCKVFHCVKSTCIPALAALQKP